MTTSSGVDSVTTTSDVPLAPVHVDAARVRRTVVGLRPFRAEGFRVAAERRGDKHVVHHYGHGGAGVTLSWGTARQAAEVALAEAPQALAVIGCGVIGLATARVLQTRGVRVTIHAASLPPDTTSNVPGAFWMPVGVCDPTRLTAAFAERLAQALREARRVYNGLAEDPRYGVRRMPLFYLDAEPPRLSPFMAVAPELFAGPRLAPGEHPFGERHALVMPGMVIDTTRYLPALLEDFRAAGGTVVVHTIERLEDVDELPERVIVNCTGLGAKALVGDETLEPVRGQLLLLEPQPEVDYIVVSAREPLYMLPRPDAVVLGTSKEPARWSLTPDPEEAARILENNRALLSLVDPRLDRA